MKTKLNILGIYALLLIAICSILVSCEKDKASGVVTYKGQVVYAKTITPFPNLEVRLTDGSNVNNTVRTDSDGRFSMKVDISTINGNYYFLVGDATCAQKNIEIPGWGRSEFDLGVIEIEGPSLPIVATKSVVSINADVAVCGGKVESDGRLAVTARGVCYSKREYPTTDDLHTEDGTGIGEFTSNLKNLDYKTIYYVRAYATNSKGTAYGEQVKFTTESGAAVVETMEVTDVTAKDAVCGGNITSDGGFPITERGLCWSTHQFPTKNDASMSDGAAGLGQFKLAIVNLQPSTTYYVRAYAVNSATVSYGEQKEFKTTDGLPIVSTTQPSATAFTISTGGNISSNGGFDISSRGVCYSSNNSEPTLLDTFIECGKGSGEYQAYISKLSANTLYYVRAYAINETGTVYGDVKSITTMNGIADLSDIEIKNITAGTASCNMTVVDAGGANLLSCGICWSTTMYPTVDDYKKELGYEVGVYYYNITNLQPSTTYYVRAYATTDVTTTYGAQTSFTTTLGLPKVETFDPGENISPSSITVRGNVIEDGGFTVTARGVVYSTLPYPTLENASKVASGSGLGYFSAKITNVTPAVNTYYIRAYATNKEGTVYGEQIYIGPERLEYLSLPVVEYGGCKYHVYRDMWSMSRSTAVRLCENLSFAGYDDWFLPDQYELRAIIEAGIGGWYIGSDNHGYFWSSSGKGSWCTACEIEGKSPCVSCDGWWVRSFEVNEDYSYHVRPVRKDKIQ